MDETTASPQPKSRRRRFVAAGIGLAILALPVAWWMIRPGPSGEAMPDPNGYADLVAAGRMVKGDFREADPRKPGNDDRLRAIVAANPAALARARVGLGRETRVPLDDAGTVQDHLDDQGALRQLGRLLACEAALAEREGRAEDAVGLYFDLIRLGRAASAGGIITDRMVEGAVQLAGVEGLNRLAATLPADRARRLAGEVEKIDRDREPLARILDRDLRFNLARGGLQLQIAYTVNRAAMQKLLAPAIKATERADFRAQSQLRLLAVTLALRAYRLDHPDAPVPPDLGALIPRYLGAVPEDPSGSGPLEMPIGSGPAGLDGEPNPGPSPERP